MVKKKRLGQIAKIYSGGTPKRNNTAFWGGTIPWVKTTQVQNCVINAINVNEFITEEGLKHSSAKMVPKGSILMAMIGQGKTRGQVAILGIDTTTNQNAAAILIDAQNSRVYVYQQLLYMYKQIRNISNSSGQQNLNLQLIRTIQLFLPPLSEQRAIAAILTTWDEAIAKTETLIKAKEKRLKWLLNELIGKPAAEGREGWRRVKLGEMCIPITRKNSIGETNVFTSSARHGLISQLHYYKKSVSGADLSKYYLLRNGDFAYNRSSANGYPFGAIKRLDKCDQGILSTLYLCFSIISENECVSDFLLAVFEASVLNRGLRAVCQEGARSHGLLNITKSDFFDLGFYLPVLENQKLIARVLTTAKEEIDLMKKMAERYRAQKRGLMQKLLTGEWRVKLERA